MKKFICMVLALMLVLGIAVSASAVPSKTTADTTAIAADANSDIVIEVVQATDDNVPEIVTIAVDELEKLSRAESIDAYYGSVLDAVKEKLGTDALKCYEFMPIMVTTDTRNDKQTDVAMLVTFASPYQAGETLFVLIGIPNADKTIEWKAFEAAVNEAGEVLFTLDADTVLAMEAAGGAIMAVISK